MKENKVKEFFTTSLNGMAFGLFATLIVGTIFGTIGYLFSLGEGNKFCDFMVSIIGKNGSKNGIAFVLQMLTGAGIGVGIALSQKFDPLHTIVMAVVGELAGYFSLTTKFVSDSSRPINDGFQIGDPLTIFVVCISVALFFMFVLKKKTPVDILLVPFVGILVGSIIALLIRFPLIYVTYGIQWLVNKGTQITPFFMGIIVAVVMGMALTAPISSAAIAAMIFTVNGTSYESILSSEFSGLALASGAAVIGCCTQMVGFMIQSRKDNNVGLLVSIGVGTSMLQFKNIIKKPIIWLPTIIASAILGPISTCLLKTVCLGSSAGMGTAGMIGILGTITSMGIDNWRTWVSIICLEIVGPILLVFLIDLLFRKFKIIKDGDLKI